MLYQQSDATLRRIGPIPVFDSGGTAVTGAFAGTKEIMLAGGAFAAAAGSVVEIGDGYYYYQASLTDASTKPFAAVRLTGSFQEVVYEEDVSEYPPTGIKLNETNAALRKVGLIPLFDSSGVAITTLVGVNFSVSLNGAAWDATPNGTLVLDSNGYASYMAAASDVASEGWIAVRVWGTCQETVFVAYVVARDEVAPTVDVVSPAEGVIAGDFETATDTALLIDISDETSVASVTVLVSSSGWVGKLCAYRRGAFESPFDLNSYASTPVAGTTRLHIRHNSGWAPGPLSIDTDIVDSAGHLDA